MSKLPQGTRRSHDERPERKKRAEEEILEELGYERKAKDASRFSKLALEPPREKEYLPPKSCTFCVHRRRDHETKHELERCALHGHDLPSPSGDFVKSVPGCGDCEGRWCPQFEAQPFPEQDYTEWFQNWIQKEANCP